MEQKVNLSYPAKIPLQDILLANGYEIDREKSTARNPVLKSNGGHKVVISLMSSGDYLYFNPNDSTDKGNIYNLAKNHGLNISELLETYLKMPVEKKFNIKARSDKENIKEIIDKFNALPCYDSQKHSYLKNRAIDSTTISNYAKNIKVDNYENVYFPQYRLVSDRKNIFTRGYTMRFATPIYKDKDGKLYDKPLKSITKGEKGLEILIPNDTSNVKSVILAESSIDTLSFAEITKNNNAILIATSGNVSVESSMEAIRFIHSKLNIQKYHLAFDNDEMGKKLTNDFAIALKEFNEFGKESVVNIHSPYTKDFNDDLKVFKLLKMDLNTHFSKDYHTALCKDMMTQEIYKATENLLDNFRYSPSYKKEQQNKLYLNKIRKLDKLLPKGIDSKLKAYFNDKVINAKDKRIKGFEMSL